MGEVMVCHCNRVSDTEVIAAIDAGADSVEEVGERCGAGTCCGCCQPTIEVLLLKHARRGERVAAEAA